MIYLACKTKAYTAFSHLLLLLETATFTITYWRKNPHGVVTRSWRPLWNLVGELRKRIPKRMLYREHARDLLTGKKITKRELKELHEV